MRFIRLTIRAAATAACALTPAVARAQLTLADALHLADRAAFANRGAAASTAIEHAQAIAPLKGILPAVRFEAGFARTTDPIGVFGSTLRQRTVSQANFDPQRLNYPAAINNYAGGVVIEQPLLNADAWLGREAANHAASAAGAAEDWTRVSTRTDVVRAYYGAVLAAERATTLQAAANAAHAHVTEADAMVRQGLATKSDALLASVRAGDVDAQLAEARGDLEMSRRQLAVLLGRDGGEGTAVDVPAALPSAQSIRDAVAVDTAAAAPKARADVRAAAEGVDAAREDALRARSTLLPRLNGFARYDWNSPDRLYAGDKNWTLGVMASWSPFAGASELADAQAAASRATAALARADGARANARLEIDQTRIALGVALARLTIAERGAAQSAEAHRIVTKKYEGGLASVVELLDAQAVETQSALMLSQARYATITAEADRLRALGRDPATLSVLDGASTVAAHDSPAPIR